MRKFGLIGYPLGHSFSATYFKNKFRSEGVVDATYDNYPLTSIEQLPDLLANEPQLEGMNVTLPYKETVIPFLDELSPEARKVGAVNCIVRRDGILTGHNADLYGFRTSLLEFIGQERPHALILGTGGASKAVACALSELGMEYRFVSRREGSDRLTYDQVTPELLRAFLLIVNATPLGTTPNTDSAPDIPYSALSPHHALFDLVYNPPKTRFLALGETYGARICNGYRMLVLQAERSWEIFNDKG